MKNFDVKSQTVVEAQAKLFDALKSDNEDAQKEALAGVFSAIADEVKAEAAANVTTANQQYQDNQILMNRGARKPLTSAERKYFNAVIEKKGWEGLNEVFPVTIVEDVLTQIEREHPILSKIDMVPVDGIMKFITAKPGAQTAFWGDICEDIRQVILDGFEVKDLTAFKLSGFVVMCKGMIELGPEWLATYITRSLYEIMSTSLEMAVVDGTGTGDKMPIGMTKSLYGVVDGVYQDKEAVALTDFSAKSLGGIRAALAEAKADNGQVSVLVNPVTYWVKMFPSLAVQTSDGKWVLSNMPTGEEIITSHAVPEGKAIFGNLKNYFLGVAGAVRIDKYEQTLAIEDLDLYIAKLYGNGSPKSANAFFVADLTNVEGATPVELDAPSDPVVGG